MVEQKPVKIGETEFTIQEFNTSESLFWSATLTQLLSGLLLGVEKWPDGGLESIQLHIGKGLRGLATHLPAKEFVTLVQKMYKDSVVFPEYDEKDFEERFAGGDGLDEFFQLLTEIIVYNYNSLMPTVKKTLAGLTGIIWSTSTVQTPAQSE